VLPEEVCGLGRPETWDGAKQPQKGQGPTNQGRPIAHAGPGPKGCRSRPADNMLGICGSKWSPVPALTLKSRFVDPLKSPSGQGPVSRASAGTLETQQNLFGVSLSCETRPRLNAPSLRQSRTWIPWSRGQTGSKALRCASRYRDRDHNGILQNLHCLSLFSRYER